MEDRSRVGGVAALVLFAGLFLAPEASAINERRDTRARSSDDGVEVSITVGEDGEARVGGGAAGGGGRTCDWRVEQYPFTGSDPPARYGEPPSPEHRLYLVFCDDEFVVAQWLGPAGAASPAVDTTALARTVVDNVPVDLFGIDVRPEGRAVTGIPSYFWVEGYDGQPIVDTVRNGPVAVAVEITLGTVTWDFGDGTPPVTAGLGEAWPERSEIRHAYRDRGDYVVTVTVTLPATFTVNGGAPTALAPITRTATIPYAVDEVQAVRDR